MAKNSRIRVEQRRARMLQMLTVRADKEQIIEALKREGFAMSSSRTYDRDYAALKEQASKWIESFATDGLVEEYQHVILSLRERVRRVILTEDQATRPADKIAANLAIRDIELDIFDLLAEGPTMWALKRKADRAGQPLSPDAAKQQT